MLVTAVNRSSSVTFNIGAPNIAEINAAYPLDTDAAKAANTAPYFHALSASTTDFAVVCDGADVESGAYISLYDSTTETFTDAPSLPPQRSGYIELVCMVPTGWQKITVTYTPTFVTNKTLTFSLSASDVAKALSCGTKFRQFWTEQGQKFHKNICKTIDICFVFAYFIGNAF